MMSDTITRQIQGVCEGVMQRGDWSEFHINIGRDYPVKLATKKDEVITIARLAGSQVAVWTFEEKEGNPNPHRPGENFKNRYLSNVQVGGQLDPALSQRSAPAGQTSMAAAPGGGVSGTGMPDDRGASIERQTIVKAAISLFPHETITTKEQWFAFIHDLDEWIAKPRGAVATAPAPAPAPAGDDFPSTDIDDIPF
jgi:hypothetical protein